MVVADKFAPDANSKVRAGRASVCQSTLATLAYPSTPQPQTVPCTAIPDGWMGLDNGPESTKMIQAELADCKTIIWNGPMGVFEMSAFAKGTLGIATLLARLTEQGATTVVGGGDSVAAIEQMKFADKVSHVSTGGGATLELLGGTVLPGVAAIQDAAK